MVKFAHVFNYFDLMEFAIFKCGSGYQMTNPGQLFISCPGFFLSVVCLLLVRDSSRWAFKRIQWGSLLTFPDRLFLSGISGPAGVFKFR